MASRANSRSKLEEEDIAIDEGDDTYIGSVGSPRSRSPVSSAQEHERGLRTTDRQSDVFTRGAGEEDTKRTSSDAIRRDYSFENMNGTGEGETDEGEGEGDGEGDAYVAEQPHRAQRSSGGTKSEDSSHQPNPDASDLSGVPGDDTGEGMDTELAALYKQQFGRR